MKNRTRKWSFVSISRHLERVNTHVKSTRERDCLRHTHSHFVVIILRLRFRRFRCFRRKCAELGFVWKSSALDPLIVTAPHATEELLADHCFLDWFCFFHFQESNADLPSEYWQIQKLVKYLKVGFNNSLHFENTFNLRISFTVRYAILLIKFSALISDPSLGTISGFENRCWFMTLLSLSLIHIWRCRRS